MAEIRRAEQLIACSGEAWWEREMPGGCQCGENLFPRSQPPRHGGTQDVADDDSGQRSTKGTFCAKFCSVAFSSRTNGEMLELEMAWHSFNKVPCFVVGKARAAGLRTAPGSFPEALFPGHPPRTQTREPW